MGPNSLSIVLAALGCCALGLPLRAEAKPRFVGIVADQSSATKRRVRNFPKEAGKPAAQVIAETAGHLFNRVVAESVPTGTESSVLKPNFEVSAVGYSSQVRPLTSAQPRIAFNVAELDPNHPSFNDGAWVEPRSSGVAKRDKALSKVLSDVRTFVAENPKAERPMVVHFTNQIAAADEKTQSVAREVMATRTARGATTLFNVHVGDSGPMLLFPTQAVIDRLPDNAFRLHVQGLFDSSSPITAGMLRKMKTEFADYRAISRGSRMLVVNATERDLQPLFTLQSRAQGLGVPDFGAFGRTQEFGW